MNEVVEMKINIKYIHSRKLFLYEMLLSTVYECGVNKTFFVLGIDAAKVLHKTKIKRMGSISIISLLIHF